MQVDPLTEFIRRQDINRELTRARLPLTTEDRIAILRATRELDTLLRKGRRS